MKSYKWIFAVLLIPAMLLAGCSGAALSLNTAQQVPNTAQQVPAPVAVAATVAPVANPPVAVAPNGALEAFQSTFEQIYSNVNPSVVNIQVIEGSSSGTNLQLPQGHPFVSPNTQGPSEALGSGFVWDSQGHIVTNNHVIAGASQISVTFSDGTTVPAKLVGADPNSDLAVIQVNVPSSQLHPVTMGDSTQVKVGQLAIAIGNPYGLAGTMTEGIVSALSRSLPVGLDNQSAQSGPTYSIPDIIQTDAAINPGNSGGVLLNDQGEVIGVTAAIQSSGGSNSGIGFVIPSAIVERVIPSLIQTGSYAHPYIGISGTTMSLDLANAMNLNPEQTGVLVIDVSPNSPAEKAGLKGSTQQATINGQQIPVGGDIITAVNNQPVKTFEDLASYLANNTQVGQTVTLTILRQGQSQTVKLTLGTLPAQPGQ
jgi:S1-C subfamily serine protease